MDHVPPPQQMFQHITAYWVTQLVGTAARLGLADCLEAGPLKVAEIATRVGANPDALYRVMRACTAAGVFTEQPDKTFTNNELSETLRSNVSGSMRDFANAVSAPGHWRPWEQLTEAVRSGKSTAYAALGHELFDWYATHPEEGAAFTGAMHNLAQMVAGELTQAMDFSTVGRVVDVGGANATLVSAVLHAFPNTRGVLLDLPNVVEAVKKALAASGLADRCETVGGDFFKAVPKGDVMLLKQILHDWNDEQCVNILHHCAESLPQGGCVIVVEMIISEDGKPSPAHMMDVNMLVLLPGKERTATEYGKLFTAAGLKLDRVLPTHSPFSILVAIKA